MAVAVAVVLDITLARLVDRVEKAAEMGYCGLELEPEEMDEAAVIKDLMGAAD